MPPPWKRQNGFHRGLNLAGEREIPTFPPPTLIIIGPKNERRTEQRPHDQARSRRGRRAGTPGGKVLKVRGPFLLKTDSAAAARRGESTVNFSAYPSLEEFTRAIKAANWTYRQLNSGGRIH